MPISYGQEFGKFATAKELLTAMPEYLNKDGLYFLYPSGKSNPGELVYCDMTTDGGGWMLITRSHPTGSPASGTWGWSGGVVGSVKDYTQPYQSGWYTKWHAASKTFTEFILGNRLNINNSQWGPFIYKYNLGPNYSTFIGTDTQQSYGRSLIKSDLTVFNSSSLPGMQGAVGFYLTGTTNNIYYFRDCCGFSTGYGGKPNSLSTTYLGHASLWWYAGPWGAGSSTDANGNFIQTTASNQQGGTNQYMIMVR